MVRSLAAAALLHLPAQSSAADSDGGVRLAAMCASCHRLDGQDRDIPSIIGLDADKLAAKLAAFRSGERRSQLMHAVALSLTDEEIATVSRYLAGLRREAAP